MKPLSLVTSILLLSGAASAQAFTGSFPLNTTNGFPNGLEHDGNGNLWFTDNGAADAIGLTDTAGNISSSIDISANSMIPLGITVEGLIGYVTDAFDDDIDEYLLIGGLAIYLQSHSVASFTTAPEGITFSPATGNLYVIDGTASSQVFEFTNSGAHVATFPLNGSSIDGIAYDPSDDTFWIYDSGTDSLRHYDSNFVELSAVPGTAALGLGAGEGVAVIGSDIYVCAPTSASVAVFSTTAVFGDTLSFGLGCPQVSEFYELFSAGGNDLSGSSFTITPTPSGFDVDGSGSFDPSFSNNLFSSDDSLFQNRSLGFTATFPGLGTTSSIDIDSNGRIGVGLSSSDFTESVGDFLANTMLGVCWDDLNPASGGALYFDNFATFAMVTWDQVPQFGDTDSNTFQVKLHDDGRIECSHVSVANDALVGLSTGAGGVDPGSIDLSVNIPFSRTGIGDPPVLSATTRPVIGTSFDLVTSNIPPTAIGGGVIFGSNQLNLVAPGLLPDGCAIFSSGDIATLPLNVVDGTSSILLANASVLVGLQLYAQTAVIDLTLGVPVPVILSNGLEFTIGDV